MKWKYISSMKTRIYTFTPKDFKQMHQQSLDHSYTSLTKLKTYQSVMILVVRLGQLTDTLDGFIWQRQRSAQVNVGLGYSTFCSWSCFIGESHSFSVYTSASHAVQGGDSNLWIRCVNFSPNKLISNHFYSISVVAGSWTKWDYLIVSDRAWSRVLVEWPPLVVCVGGKFLYILY
jgi:hypothetical protein